MRLLFQRLLEVAAGAGPVALRLEVLVLRVRRRLRAGGGVLAVLAPRSIVLRSLLRLSHLALDLLQLFELGHDLLGSLVLLDVAYVVHRGGLVAAAHGGVLRGGAAGAPADGFALSHREGVR